jgi:hypothetical protein
MLDYSVARGWVTVHALPVGWLDIVSALDLGTGVAVALLPAWESGNAAGAPPPGCAWITGSLRQCLSSVDALAGRGGRCGVSAMAREPDGVENMEGRGGRCSELSYKLKTRDLGPI